MSRQKLTKDQSKHWDIEHEESGIKIRVKSLQVRDGLGYAQTERMLIDRYKDTDTLGDPMREAEMMYLVQNYPILRYGIAEAEGLRVPLTEEDFWDMPESVMRLAVDAVQEKNPQYGGIPFGELKTMIFKSLFQATEDKPNDTSPIEQSAKSS